MGDAGQGAGHQQPWLWVCTVQQLLRRMHPHVSMFPVGASTQLRAAPCSPVWGDTQRASQQASHTGAPQGALQSTPCWLPIRQPADRGFPEGCHMLSQKRATAMPASLTPRSPAARGGAQDVSPSCQSEQQALSGVGTGTMVGGPAQTALVLANVRDVRHCFINVQMLPNKEAQVGPEMPARADGAERWVGHHPRGKVVVGLREHFTLYSLAFMYEGCRVKQRRQRMSGREGGSCWGFPWQRCSSSSCLLQNFLHLPQLPCSTKETQQETEPDRSRPLGEGCQHQAAQVSLYSSDS